MKTSFLNVNIPCKRVTSTLFLELLLCLLFLKIISSKRFSCQRGILGGGIHFIIYCIIPLYDIPEKAKLQGQRID